MSLPLMLGACCDIYGEGSWISCRPRQDFQNKPQTVYEREEKLMGILMIHRVWILWEQKEL